MNKLDPSQAQLKNEQFKLQIRRKMKSEYMNKIRSNFLMMEQRTQSKVRGTNNSNIKIQNCSLAELQKYLQLAPSSENIGLINRIIIDRRGEIGEQLYKRLLNFIKIHLINRDETFISNKPELNDLIALFANLLSFKNVNKILEDQFNFPLLVNKLLTLIEIAPKTSGSLIIWVLFQIVEISPISTIHKIVQKQLYFKQNFGLSNIYLSHLFMSIMLYDPKLISGQIIEQYTVVDIKSQTCTYFCQNIINIFQLFLKTNQDESKTQQIMRWIIFQFLCPQFPRLAKTSLLKLLLTIIHNNLNIVLLSNLISQSSIINQLIQHSLFDTQYDNKIASLNCLNQLIRICPRTQLQELIFSHESLLQALVSSLSLNTYEIIVASLYSISKIIMNWPQNMLIHDKLIDTGLKMELESLQFSKNQKISNLACSLLQDYLSS